MEKKHETIISRAKNTLKNNVTEIEKRDDLSEEEKINKIIIVFSSTCAAVAIQPIPFADIFILTPIQALMGTRIAAIRGINIKEAKATEIVKEIAGAVGLGLLAQQLAIGAYKTFIPFLGAITTIPMVFGLTYGIGKVMDAYFKAKAKGENLSRESIQNLFQSYKEEGRNKSKNHSDEIKKSGKDLQV